MIMDDANAFTHGLDWNDIIPTVAIAAALTFGARWIVIRARGSSKEKE